MRLHLTGIEVPFNAVYDSEESSAADRYTASIAAIIRLRRAADRLESYACEQFKAFLAQRGDETL